jgi:hypothetical protein
MGRPRRLLIRSGQGLAVYDRLMRLAGLGRIDWSQVQGVATLAGVADSARPLVAITARAQGGRPDSCEHQRDLVFVAAPDGGSEAY